MSTESSGGEHNADFPNIPGIALGRTTSEVESRAEALRHEMDVSYGGLRRIATDATLPISVRRAALAVENSLLRRVSDEILQLENSL